MKIVILVALFTSVCIHSSRADDARAPKKFVGKFAFNFAADPAKQKCRPVTAAFAGDLAAKHFSCAPGDTPTAAGLKPVVCADAAKKVQYLLFDSNKTCEDERKEQAANE